MLTATTDCAAPACSAVRAVAPAIDITPVAATTAHTASRSAPRGGPHSVSMMSVEASIRATREMTLPIIPAMVFPALTAAAGHGVDRTRAVWGKREAVRVAHGGRRLIKK